MKSTRPLILLAAMMMAAGAGADDGELLRKTVSKAPGQPDTTPISEAEHAFVDMMPVYVPAQSSDGTIGITIDYINADGVLVEQRTTAKPLIEVYMYGPVELVEGLGFVGHGRRDAFAAVSFDDGNTWKRTNLSETADLSSSDVVRSDIPLYADLGGEYPGDVINMFQSTDGRRTIAVWPSRYCSSGEPNYSLEGSNLARRDAIATYLGIDLNTPSPDDIYLLDFFGVGGQQGSVDYAQDKFEMNHPVGVVPFACLWAARGTLETLDDGTSEIVWRKAERLTSGRRDVNRVEVNMVANVGAVITWQEDPEGLRPGQGEGPGEGWSGAVAGHQTDIWYSYIAWDHFDLVQGESDATVIQTLDAYYDAGSTAKPKVAIPFAMPMRLSDNGKCNVTNPAPYCNGSAISGTRGPGPGRVRAARHVRRHDLRRHRSAGGW